MKKPIIISVSLLILFSLVFLFYKYNLQKNSTNDIAQQNIEKSDYEIFYEKESAHQLFLTTPNPNEVISVPLFVTGITNENWFSQGNFSVTLVGEDGEIIIKKYAKALDDWTAEEFVPFEAILEFDIPEDQNKGNILLKKANPSGLAENDDVFEIPILFHSK
ncbi:MAG: hypothetical protein COX80_00910 [Candidatus Magasanikbacteria bacterium CG_4_10_14_0_2_um_filter_33_14]|uniref:Bacterial spore germination immunoglobulin-like domain-containing protein n=1 Tax=Candidatus Magasanikbacteria bacterium CG_4_10_14_0_2_um_filter_33_14 TaxID=1974636 RepID=A0A2M7VC22_9BACT|nr:MAG: hypothetical protein COX80_00910 [Candidatus Magasanikbacteria bacterium CG_4_10_14_0_2_um_filter_33_14]